MDIRKNSLSILESFFVYVLVFIHEVMNFLYRLLLKQKSEKYDLLLIRTDGVGDYIIWLDSLRVYKDVYKGKKVMLICSKQVLNLAELDPFFTKVISINRSNFLKIIYRYRITKIIRNYYFNHAISPIFTRGYVSDSLMSIVRSDQKIGFNGDSSNMFYWQKCYMNLFYTKLIDSPKNNQMEIYTNAFFVQMLFSIKHNIQLPILPKLPEYDFYFDKDYVVFFLSATDPLRVWNIDKFVDVAKSLAYKYKIVLLGNGSFDHELSCVFLKLYNDDSNVINFVNKTSLIETAQIVTNASFVIGNDSGGIHLAVSLKKPSLAIVSGAHLGRFFPYPKQFSTLSYFPHIVYHNMDCFGCDYKCIRVVDTNYECIGKINADKVKNELYLLLMALNNSLE